MYCQVYRHECLHVYKHEYRDCNKYNCADHCLSGDLCTNQELYTYPRNVYKHAYAHAILVQALSKVTNNADANVFQSIPVVTRLLVIFLVPL